MDFSSSIACLVLTSILIVLLYSSIFQRTKTSHAKLPPGPSPIPVLGNLLSLDNKPHKSLARLAKIHGPIMSLKLGSLTTVVISSPAAAKQVLQKHDVPFSSRTIPDAVRAHSHHELGMPWIPVSPLWRSLRKICNARMFAGQSLAAEQNTRSSKVRQLLSFVRESCDNGVAIDIGKAAFSTTLNMLSNAIFSVDMTDPGSDSTNEFKELVWNMMEEIGKPNLADYFPALKMIDPQGRRRRLTGYAGRMIGVFDELIKTRLLARKTAAGSVETEEDLLDTLLGIEESSHEIDRRHTEHLFLDLFVAGTDTTSNTLEWAMAELLHNPTILSKAREEMDQIIGKGRPVEEVDLARLPYLHAIIKETFRLHPPTPLLLPRKAEEDVDLCGFRVPKGAQVLVNAWAIGRDPRTWDNPKLFWPERFLGSDVDVKGQDFELIPFGAGRRICPAVGLASRMLQLMLASLVHSFEWKLEDGIGAEDMNMEDEFGITLRKAQRLHAIPMHRINCC
ncbi:geraniol 8-hydroxylase-like [Rhododendron vialii]|uniref:geraniol 8-hydroxylase-like n=1 Tax=Rhododendron vialii TaxID=182163 RepID=UPI00265E8CFE|nr:geraniol 8-hydroxylase-like [Rhododendron vialii]